MSGPISFYDPLAPAAPPLPGPAAEAPRSGRRRKPDPLSAEVPLNELDRSAPPAPAEGGRRRRFDPDDENTEDVQPFRGQDPGRADSAMGALNSSLSRNDDAARSWDPAPAWSPDPLSSPPSRGFEPPQAAAPAAPIAAPPMSRSARRHAEAQRQNVAERPAEQPWQPEPPRRPEPQRPPEPPRQPQQWHSEQPWPGEQRPAEQPWQGEQSWQGEQRQAEVPPWQGESQRDPEPPRQPEIQRLPGGRRHDEQLRDGRAEHNARVEHEERAGLPSWSARRRPAAGAVPEAAPHDRTELLPRNRADGPRDRADANPSWSAADQDQMLMSGETVAGEMLRDRLERDEQRAEHDSRRGGKRRGAGTRRRGGAAVRERDLDEHLTDVYEPLDDDEDDDYDDEPGTSVVGRLSAVASRAARRARPAPSRARADLSDDEEHRRQWLVLAGQSTGAAVAGMLLFKGFERLWEMLPWVALALSMIVILGLVALVRVLRRTDDIFSTVIAVVVGVFVTLGPLAFLLSTN
ncbi:hypothetical protein [Nocardia sp. NPDC057668]|uniref:hypothetical protein n=1 Tax=Nocardia sp. NPDC057668 TaxID=3346202 RepID=UPI00367213B7